MNKILRNMPKIIVQLNLLNFNKQLVMEITKKLELLILSNKLKAQIKFAHSESYWKYPEETLCFFYIYSSKWILVKDFINIFDVKFDYSVGPIYMTVNSIDCYYTSENAVWSFNTEKNIFLDKNITWAHFYTNAIDLNLKCDFQLND